MRKHCDFNDGSVAYPMNNCCAMIPQGVQQLFAESETGTTGLVKRAESAGTSHAAATVAAGRLSGGPWRTTA